MFHCRVYFFLNIKLLITSQVNNIKYAHRPSDLKCGKKLEVGLTNFVKVSSQKGLINAFLTSAAPPALFSRHLNLHAMPSIPPVVEFRIAVISLHFPPAF